MRCKKCGASLRTGTRVCPHCGEKVVIEKVGRNEFTWDTNDLPRPSAGRKKTGDGFMSWGGESDRVGKTSGPIENKQQSKARFVWPDEPDDPMTRKMREKQSAAEQGTDKSGSHEAVRAEKLKKLKEESSQRFRWDSEDDSPSLGKGSSVSGNFLSWDETEQTRKPKPRRSAPLEMDFGGGRQAAPKKRRPVEAEAESQDRAERTGLKAGTKAVLADLEKNDWESAPVSNESNDFRFTRPDLTSMKTERAAAELKHSSEAEDIEKSVFDEFRNIVDSEKLFDDNLEKLSFLTEEEQEEIRAAEEKAERIKSTPAFSFDSIESEYDRYRRENGGDTDKALTYEEKVARLKKMEADMAELEERERRAMKEAEAKLDAEEGVPEQSAEKSGEDVVAVSSAPAEDAPVTRPRRKKNKGNKEVEIKINEPSGTKVTVKTQEISIADIQDGLDVMSVKTREVDLSDLKKNPMPTNVQVSVEVNGADNTSVEVTRRHDGATLVKTVDNTTGRATLADDDPNRVGGAAYTDEQFWDHPTDEKNRMTITDIFGPEARKIIDKLDKKAGKDVDDTMMLDIDPEDIQLSEEQTKQLLLDEDPDEFMDGLPDIDLSNVNLMEEEEYEDSLDEDLDAETEEVSAEAEAEEPAEEAAEAEEDATGEATAEAEGSGDEKTAEAAEEVSEEASEEVSGEAEADAATDEASDEELTGEATEEAADQAAEESGEAEAQVTGEAVEAAEETATEESATEPETAGEATDETGEAEVETAEENVQTGEAAAADAPKTESETAEELAADLTGPLAVSADIYEAAEEASLATKTEQAAPDAPVLPEEPAFEAKPAGEIPEVNRSWKDAADESADVKAPAGEDARVPETVPAQSEGSMGVMAAEAMPGAAVMTEILDDDEPEAGDIPAEGTVEPEAEVLPAEENGDAEAQAESAEAPAPVAAAKPEKKKKKRSEDRGGFSAPVKAIIAVLIVLLALEFTVIGVKLFARDSQANVFIERVEQQIFALDDTTGDSGLKL